MIGAGAQREPRDRRDDAGHIDPQHGQQIVDQQQLHQQRHAAKEADIYAGGRAEPRVHRGARRRHAEPQRDADDDRDRADEDGVERRLDEQAEQGGGHGLLDGVSAAAGRPLLPALRGEGRDEGRRRWAGV